MSDYQHKDLTGSLFKNEYKEKDTHPDYKGTALVNGRELEVAGWISQTKAGKTFLSLKFGEPYNKDKAEQPTRKEPAISDDLPF